MKRIIFFLLLGSMALMMDAKASRPVLTETQKQAAWQGIVTPIFQNLDPKKLKSLMSAEDPVAIQMYYKELGRQLIESIRKGYGMDISKEVGEQYELAILYGYLYFLQENGVKDIQLERPAPSPVDPLDCIVSAVSGLLSINEIQGIYNSFMAGATSASIIKTLKFALKRVATAWTILATVYSLGSCMDWW